MRPKRVTSFCNGVGASAVASSNSAMRPISVSMPVAVTTARPVPCAIAVPLNTIFKRSPNAAACANVAGSLSTATLSPVSEASCTCSAAASNRRASAPTASPSASTNTSPRTNSALGTCFTAPSRNTLEFASVMRASAATAFCALASSAYPRPPLSKTMAAMTIASTGQPARPSIIQASNAIKIAASKR